jgi:hypothetical protein
MPKTPIAMFVEPCDVYTNQIIATQMLTEESFHKDKRSVDGTCHSVWKFEPGDRDKLKCLAFDSGTRYHLYREDKQGMLVRIGQPSA